MSTHRHHTLARSAGVFTGATLLSRVLGYARDSLIATFFGAGTAADAFYAAFRIANLLRRLLAEGTLSAAFIPVFATYNEQHGREKAQAFLSTMATTLGVLLFALTAAGILAAPWITRAIAMGFTRTPERFALTVTLTRIMFPFLFFVCLAALLTGALNAVEAFFLPALAPACLSLAEIIYLLAIAPLLSPPQRIIGLGLAVGVGGLAQLLIHLPALWKKGLTLRWRWDWHHPGMRRVGALMLPATLGISVDQVNNFVDTICASFLVQGSVTALYYANRLMQLPLALFGVALSQVALPSMAASVARGEPQEVRDTLNFALRLTFFMVLPASTGLIVFGHPIVQLLFQHGQFTAEATARTTWALLFFSAGLIAYASVKILAGAFYAHQNTRVPVVVAVSCVALNATLDFIFIRWTTLGVGGLALATTLASWINAAVLYALAHRRLGALGGWRLLQTLLKSSLACSGMALFCRFILLRSEPVALLWKVGVGIGGGVLVYMAIARLLRMEEWGPFWAQLRRRQPAPALSD